nr:hypothetical protein [Lachnospiraceae bacterium]
MSAFLDKLVLIWRAVKRFYASWCVYLTMAAKCAVAFCAFSYINQYFPGRAFLLRFIVVAAISLLASVLPWKYLSFLAAVWLLAQLSALSLEAAAFTFVVLLILALARYLLLPGSGLALVVLPILFLWKVPFLVPLVVGVTGVLSGFVSVGSGVVIFYLLQFLSRNLEYLTAPEGDTLVQRLFFLLKGMAEHPQLMTVVLCFCLTTLVVYLISRLKVDYAPQIAVGFGAVLDPLLLAGIFDFLRRPAGPESLVWGSLVSLLIALMISFAHRFLNYAKTENVQFEDDEYYYYVKAVPKIALSVRDRKRNAAAAETPDENTEKEDAVNAERDT